MDLSGVLSFMPENAGRIAILGWGSLLWECRPDFDGLHGPWYFDGPTIKLEFSRVSSTRLGALTLVIDESRDVEATQVAYTLSERSNPDSARRDLREREGVPRDDMENSIGIISSQHSYKSINKNADRAIRDWSKRNRLAAVIWTDLPSNFEKKAGKKFSDDNAISYLQTLGPYARTKAAEYVWRAPSFVQTPLREALDIWPCPQKTRGDTQ